MGHRVYIHCVPGLYANRYFFYNSGSFQQKAVKFGTFCGNIFTCSNPKVITDLLNSKQTAAIFVTCCLTHRDNFICKSLRKSKI